jgi:hypothetical protein
MKKVITMREFCEELSSIVEKAGLRAICESDIIDIKGGRLFYIRASRDKYVTALCEIAADALKGCDKVVCVRFTKPWAGLNCDGVLYYAAELKCKLSAKYRLQDSL